MTGPEHEQNLELSNLIHLKCPYCERIEKFPDWNVFRDFAIPSRTEVKEYPALPDGRVLIEHKRCGRIIVLSHQESITLRLQYRMFAFRHLADSDYEKEHAT